MALKNTSVRLMKIPAKFLMGIGLVTLVWFVLMFYYVNDLKSTEGFGLIAVPRVRIHPRNIGHGVRSKFKFRNSKKPKPEWMKSLPGNQSASVGNFDEELDDFPRPVQRTEPTQPEVMMKRKRKRKKKKLNMTQVINRPQMRLQKPSKVLVNKSRGSAQILADDQITNGGSPQNHFRLTVSHHSDLPRTHNHHSQAYTNRSAFPHKHMKLPIFEFSSRHRDTQLRSFHQGAPHLQISDGAVIQIKSGSNETVAGRHFGHLPSSSNSKNLHPESVYREKPKELKINIDNQTVQTRITRNRDLTRDEMLDLLDGTKRHAFNVSASEMTSLDRDVPDFRPDGCQSQYPTNSSRKLPKASVIICFHNEAWSTLLRTVHSVLRTSSEDLLKEVILVDDASTHDYLGVHLENYLHQLHKVYLLRTKRREGLVRARLLGVGYASGEALVFLDSHCECGPGWLLTLLTALAHDRTKVVSPLIDIIDNQMFEYKNASPDLHGAFDWNLQFVWKHIPQREKLHRKSDADPIRTPTMIGGLFAMDRAYFQHLGAYDSNMNIWGGENIELSFRVWMCGGSLEILPCSRVGHVFRQFIPYGFPAGGQRTIQINSMRVAEVWIDQYKKFYYAAQNLTRRSSLVREVSPRRQLRHQLKCRDFQWYLNHVIPEMVLPSTGDEYFGQIVSVKDSTRCVHRKNDTVINKQCRALLGNQIFHLEPGGRLRHYDDCLEAEGDLVGEPLPCSRSTSHWRYTQTQHLLVSTPGAAPRCLTLLTSHESLLTSHEQLLRLHKCNAHSAAQKWRFSHHFDQTKLHSLYD